MEKDKSKIILLHLGIVLIIIAAIALMPRTFTIAEHEQREVITVSESVELESMPDEAHVYVEIETSAPSATQAKNQNTQTSDNVIEAIKAYGVSEGDIETTSYYLSDDRKWDREDETYVTLGYKVRHVLKVTTYDVENAGEIVDLAVGAGATGVNNVQFTLSVEKEKEVKGEALQEAAQKAEAKAQSIVDAIDVKLGDVVSIQESSYHARSYPMYAETSYAAMDMAFEESAPTIAPQQVQVSGTVTVTYALIQ